MQYTDQKGGLSNVGRFRLGIGMLLLGVVCILSLTRVTYGAGRTHAVLALLGVTGLVVGTLVIGSSAPQNE